MIVYLCSPAASATHGAALRVDGGVIRVRLGSVRADVAASHEGLAPDRRSSTGEYPQFRSGMGVRVAIRTGCDEGWSSWGLARVDLGKTRCPRGGSYYRRCDFHLADRSGQGADNDREFYKTKSLARREQCTDRVLMRIDGQGQAPTLAAGLPAAGEAHATGGSSAEPADCRGASRPSMHAPARVEAGNASSAGVEPTSHNCSIAGVFAGVFTSNIGRRTASWRCGLDAK